MKLTIKLFITSLLIVFGFVPAASAEIKIHPDSNAASPQIIEWMKLSERFWGQELDCRSGIEISYMIGDYAWASARLAGCEMTLNRKYMNENGIWIREMCDVIVHEYGHLLGFGHSADPKNIMYPITTKVVPECETNDGLGSSIQIKEPDFITTPEENNTELLDLFKKIVSVKHSLNKRTIRINVGNRTNKKVKVRTCVVPKRKKKCFTFNVSANKTRVYKVRTRAKTRKFNVVTTVVGYHKTKSVLKRK